MRATVAGRAERNPRRSHLSVPAGPSGRGELAAGLATAILLAQVVFTPVILGMCVLLTALGWWSRWRPRWLAWPAGAGLVMMLQAGTRRGAAAMTAAVRVMASQLAAAASRPARLAHPAAALAAVGHLMPAQLPLALAGGSAEAAVLLWLASRSAPARWRPGPLAALRRRIAAGALAAGQTVTRDGFALGLDAGTGRPAGISWAEAGLGVLLTGHDGGALAASSLSVVCAAIRLRKTVVILDAADGVPAPPPGTPESWSGAAPLTAWRSLGDEVARLADKHGVPVTTVGRSAPPPPGDDRAAAALGRAVRNRGVVVLRASPGQTAGQLAGDLTGVLASLRDLGLRADCLAVVADAEAVQPGPLTALLALAPVTGTALLLATSSAAAAAALGPAAGTVVVSGQVSEAMALQLAGRGSAGGAALPARLAAQPAGELTVLRRAGPVPTRVASGRISSVLIELDRVR